MNPDRSFMIPFRLTSLISIPGSPGVEPTPDGGTRVTETFDTSRANDITDAVVRWAKFYERNREGILGTLGRLKTVAEADAAGVQSGQA